MAYLVRIEDNFHYGDPTARSTFGEFQSMTDAINACKKIVNESLLGLYSPGMTAEQLYFGYTSQGDDPYIICDGPTVPFSGWEYAKERVAEICSSARRDSG